MMLLILTILLNAYVGLILKVFHKYKVSILQAIIVNYIVCVITGCLFLKQWPFTSVHLSSPMALSALFMGSAYFVVFIAMGRCVVQNGVSVMQVANKLSLIIPIVFSWLYFGESITWIKWLGIVFAIAAVWYSSQTNHKSNKASLALPLFIFIGSGLLDASTKFIQQIVIKEQQHKDIYLIFCFATAAVISSSYLIYKIAKGQERFEAKSIVAGIVLGIPNYFSIYTFISVLQGNIMQSSAIIPVVNISVVLVSAIIGFLLFKDKLNTKQWLGLGLAVVSICAIILGDVSI